MRIVMRAGQTPFGPPPAGSPRRLGYGNSGNLIFAQAVYKTFSKHANSIDVDGYDPDFMTVEEINERYDAFVLPLANAFRPQFAEHLEKYTKLIRLLRIPCVVVGVGAQAGLDLAELSGSPMDEIVRAFVSAVLDRSASIGVRGEFTRDYLGRLGFRAVDVIGCPSLCLYGGHLRVARPRPPLGVWDRIAVNHTGRLRPAMELARQALCNHPDGVFVAQTTAESESWKTIVSTGSSAGESRVRHFTDVLAWLRLLRTCRFSFGTRIHGNIAALLAGVPAFLIAHDSRTLELARYHRIPYTLNESSIASTDAAAFYARADTRSFNNFVSENFDRYRAFLETNGLDHAFDNPQNAVDFERRLAQSVPEASG
jgi:hypothetical protein